MTEHGAIRVLTTADEREPRRPVPILVALVTCRSCGWRSEPLGDGARFHHACKDPMYEVRVTGILE